MNTETLLHIFYRGANLLEETDDDSIEIGTMLPIDCPVAVEKIMEYNCSLVDALLLLPQSQLQTVELLAMRGITYREFSTVLFDTSINQTDFGKYPALRCLFLSSNKERREKLFYGLTRDWNGYENLLAQMLQPFHTHLFEFLFCDESEC